MPKDATKNIDRYKIRGGQLNEFDFHQNQEQFAELQKKQATKLIPGTPPEAKVEGLQPLVAAVREPSKKKPAKAAKVRTTVKAKKAVKAKKSTKSKNTAPLRGATAKKLAARKAAKKK